MANQLNVYDLHRGMLSRRQKERECYMTVLERCYARIRRSSQAQNFSCVFEIPCVIMGMPLFDLDTCAKFVIRNLVGNGFSVEVRPPTALSISWELFPDANKKKNGDATAALLAPLPLSLPYSSPPPRPPPPLPVPPPQQHDHRPPPLPLPPQSNYRARNKNPTVRPTDVVLEHLRQQRDGALSPQDPRPCFQQPRFPTFPSPPPPLRPTTGPSPPPPPPHPQRDSTAAVVPRPIRDFRPSGRLDLRVL